MFPLINTNYLYLLLPGKIPNGKSISSFETGGGWAAQSRIRLAKLEPQLRLFSTCSGLKNRNSGSKTEKDFGAKGTLILALVRETLAEILSEEFWFVNNSDNRREFQSVFASTLHWTVNRMPTVDSRGLFLGGETGIIAIYGS
jgi:hypothetical protein